MKHEAGKRKVVESGESLGQTFVASRQASEPCRPCKATFNHPAARQQYEAALRLGMFDYFHLDAMFLRRSSLGRAIRRQVCGSPAQNKSLTSDDVRLLTDAGTAAAAPG